MIAKVPLSESDFVEAEGYQREVLSKVSHFENYAGSLQKNRYRDGRVCEIAFGRWLEGNGVRFIEKADADGKSDDYDYMIFGTGDDPLFTVDVKGTLVLGARFMAVPIAQRPSKAEFLFGVTATQVTATMHGAISAKSFYGSPSFENPLGARWVCATRAIRLNDLPLSSDAFLERVLNVQKNFDVPI